MENAGAESYIVEANWTPLGVLAIPSDPAPAPMRELPRILLILGMLVVNPRLGASIFPLKPGCSMYVLLIL